MTNEFENRVVLFSIVVVGFFIGAKVVKSINKLFGNYGSKSKDN